MSQGAWSQSVWASSDNLVNHAMTVGVGVGREQGLHCWMACEQFPEQLLDECRLGQCCTFEALLDEYPAFELGCWLAQCRLPGWLRDALRRRANVDREAAWTA